MEQMRTFLRTQVLEDSSFMNRQGESDLYYTAFGWALAHLLKLPLEAEKQASYLVQQRPEELDLVHYAAFRRCQLAQRLNQVGNIRTFFEMNRRRALPSLESFATLPLDDAASPYTLFLWLSLQEDCGQAKMAYAQPIDFSRYQTPEGGYSNIAGHTTAAINATTAALSVLGQQQGYRSRPALSYLLKSQEPTGGFKATASAPIPDLLSTATALFTLKNYGVAPHRDATDFVEAHWLDNGSFAPTLLEEESDVEYLFYGLLALGSL